MLADRRRACHAQVGIDVDLADRHFRRLAEHFFGDPDRVRHLTAVTVDHFDEILRNGGSPVQYDGEAGEALCHLFQNVKAELRFGTGLELIGAVAGADRDGEGIDPRLGRKFINFVRIGELRVLCADFDRVLDAREFAEFRLDHHAVVVGIIDHFARDADIFVQRVFGSVDHDGGEAVFDAALAEVEGIAVIQVQRDGETGGLDRRFHQLFEVDGIGVFSRARGDLQDEGRILRDACVYDSLDDFHIVDVKSADRIAVLIALFEHFFGCDQWHKRPPKFDWIQDRRPVKPRRAGRRFCKKERQKPSERIFPSVIRVKKSACKTFLRRIAAGGGDSRSGESQLRQHGKKLFLRALQCYYNIILRNCKYFL